MPWINALMKMCMAVQEVPVMARDLIAHFDAVKADWLASGRAGKAQQFAEPLPFVTIARQAGAGGRTLALRLAKRLNERDDPSDPPWRPYDRELVEKVAADHQLSKHLIEMLEDSSHNWIRELVEPFLHPSQPSELEVFHRVAATIRALAQAGRAVLVGRGGVFITGDMARGTHVYLVAPLEDRVRRLVEEWHLAEDEAGKLVREMDQHRQSFCRRHFPDQELVPEAFTITLNTANVTVDQLVDMLLPQVSSVGLNR
jgi:hypothetical protein